MKRSWRLVIEVGGNSGGQVSPPALPPQPSSNQPEPPPLATDEAWDTLVDARTKLVDALANGDENKINSTNSWLGGAVALYAMLTGDDGQQVLDRLAKKVPQVQVRTPYECMGEFYEVERKRPAPPPGAPRPVDPADLSPEEREKLGIVLDDGG